LTLSGQRKPFNNYFWKKYLDMKIEVKHDVKLHNAWLAAGRPLPFIH
jgi:hypothetical protein